MNDRDCCAVEDDSRVTEGEEGRSSIMFENLFPLRVTVVGEDIADDVFDGACDDDEYPLSIGSISLANSADFGVPDRPCETLPECRALGVRAAEESSDGGVVAEDDICDEMRIARSVKQRNSLRNHKAHSIASRLYQGVGITGCISIST